MYTCPMHPQIKQENPGNCPICGMTLEPLDVSENNYVEELKSLKLRLIVSFFLTIIIMVVTMGSDFINKIVSISYTTSIWLQLIITTPVVLWGAYPILKKGVGSIVNKSLNMYTLISLGILVAYCYSVVVTFIVTFVPSSSSNKLFSYVYFEAAAAFTFFTILGEILELKARLQTSNAIKGLLNLMPKKAIKLNKDGGEEEVSLSSIQKGDHLKVLPGAKIPTDGIVISGSALVDEAMLTGESVPNLKEEGSKVIGATVNTEGVLIIEATALKNETLLHQIATMVRSAQMSITKVQRLVDIISAIFVPLVIAIAIVSFLVWLIFFPQFGLNYAIISAISILIIACPCALGLATPMAIMVGVGKAAKHGVLIKNSESLETLAKANTIVFDKTGTLTEGKPTVNNFIVMKGFNQEYLLSLIVNLEKNSEHVLGKAIINYAKQYNVQALPVKNFKSVIGQGIQGEIDNKLVLLGNQAFVKVQKEELTSLAIESYLQKGQTIIYAIVENTLAAVVVIGDTIKDNAKEVITNLTKENIKTIMLTGDNKLAAATIANNLSVTKVIAEVSPLEKQNTIKQLRTSNNIIVMVGDGINDAPALASANVGIAMATGTDIAMESADITIIKGNLASIPFATKVSKAVLKTIKQNLFFAFFYNTIGILFAAGAFYPFLGFLASPMIASAAMAFSSVSVILNSLRINWLKY